jgi:hypothetical protein
MFKLVANLIHHNDIINVWMEVQTMNKFSSTVCNTTCVWAFMITWCNYFGGIQKTSNFDMWQHLVI